MINAEIVQAVAAAIPVGEPSDLDELCRLLPQHTSNSVMLALEVLTKHGGLKHKGSRGSWVYWWAGSRPALDIRDPVKSPKPLGKDEQWFADFHAAKGGTDAAA